MWFATAVDAYGDAGGSEDGGEIAAAPVSPGA